MLRSAPGLPPWRCLATGRVALITPEGVVVERDVASAALVSCRNEAVDGGTGRRIEVVRRWTDGLVARQSFRFWSDAPEFEAELSIRPSREFRLALRSLSPLARPDPRSANLVFGESAEVDPNAGSRAAPTEGLMPPIRAGTPGADLAPSTTSRQIRPVVERPAESQARSLTRRTPIVRVLDVGWSAMESARVVDLQPGNELVATGLTAIGTEDGLITLTLGFLEASRAVGEYRLAASADNGLGLDAGAVFGTADLAPTETTSGPLYLSASRLDDALPRFAAAWRERHPRPGQPNPLVQWQPGAANAEPPTESIILDRLAAAAAWVGEPALDVVTVGPGWEHGRGSWLADPARFPHGLTALRDAITSQGLRAGIRFAPLLVERSSEVFQEHPTWVIRSETADPVDVGAGGAEVFVLDPTQPAVRAWIGALGRRIGEDWQFDLAQMDCLAPSVIEGWRAAAGASSVEALREGLAALRRALPGCLLVAAEGPLFASLDLADVVQSSSQPLCRADPSPLLRAFLGGTGTLVGPGPTVLDRDGQTDDEARATATIACFGGGSVTLVGDLGRLSSGRSQILRACLPPYHAKLLVPIDPFGSAGPTLFGGRVERRWDDYAILLALNPTNAPIARVVPLAALGLPAGHYHAFEFWTQTYLGTVDERVTLERIPDGGCAVVALRRVQGEPQVVGTSLHVTQGAVALQAAEFDHSACRLHLAVGATGERQGTVSVALPRGWTAGPIRGTGGSFSWRQTEERLVEVALRFKDVADVELEFWTDAL